MCFIDGEATLYESYNEKSTLVTNSNVIHEKEFFTVDPVYNNRVRALGQLGAGLEFRLTCHIGLMADFTWNFVFGRDRSDKFQLITEQGTATTAFQDIFFGTFTTNTIVTNQALNLKPGNGSDHQDFGM